MNQNGWQGLMEIKYRYLKNMDTQSKWHLTYVRNTICCPLSMILQKEEAVGSVPMRGIVN